MTHCIITFPSSNPEIPGISPFCSRIRIPLQILRRKSTTYVTFCPLEAELQIFLLTRVSYEVFTSMIDFYASSCLISMHAIGEQLGALLVPFVCLSLINYFTGFQRPFCGTKRRHLEIHFLLAITDLSSVRSYWPNGDSL